MQVIEPVRSRCLCIRVAAPTYPEVEHMLSYVAQKEGLKLPDPLRQRIAQTSERNLRRALLCFETCKMAQYPFTDSQTVQMTDWELYIQVCCCDACLVSPAARLSPANIWSSLPYKLVIDCQPRHCQRSMCCVLYTHGLVPDNTN